ncbi:MAG TPA: hypothetical protein VGD94_15870 [Vicinamibacterales bacterium]
MLNDFRYTLRGSVEHPCLHNLGVPVMAVGIAVNVAVFSVADAALFRPLPYEEPQRLVHAYQMVTTVTGERLVDRPDTAIKVMSSSCSR